MATIRSDRDEIGLIIAQIASRVCVLNRKAKLLRELCKALDVVGLLQEPSKFLLEFIAAGYKVENTLAGLEPWARPRKRWRFRKHPSRMQKLRLQLFND